MLHSEAKARSKDCLAQHGIHGKIKHVKEGPVRVGSLTFPLAKKKDEGQKAKKVQD